VSFLNAEGRSCKVTVHFTALPLVTPLYFTPPPHAAQVSFLNAEGRSCKVIVYFLTCASVEFHSLVLQRLPQLKGLQVAALHGKLKQVGCLLV
jgi:hypothetical protein